MRGLGARAVPVLCLALNVMLGAMPVSVQAKASADAPRFAEADSLFFAMRPLSVLRLLEAQLEANPDDYQACWRAARAALTLGVITDARALKESWFRLSEAYAGQSLALRPGDVDAIALLAAGKGRLAIDIAGARGQVRLGLEVWELTHQVLAIDPSHALAKDVLGKLYQEVRSLSLAERLLARAFLGGGDAMKRATWRGSETHLRRAISADPTFVLFYLDLGDTYRLRGKRGQAMSTSEAGLAVPDLYPPDPMYKRQMRRRLDELRR